MTRARLVVVTDAWYPQVNGVVTTLDNTINQLQGYGVQTWVIEPGRFHSWPLPGYGEIRLAMDVWRVARMLRDLRPDHVHIATEGPLGIAARLAMGRWGAPFTTSLHTKFPEYVAHRTGLPVRWGYRYLRWFHRPAAVTLVTTPSQHRELTDWGLTHLVVWERGVDAEFFQPAPREPRDQPLLVYVGRVAVEKNLRAFLDLPNPGRKVIVGGGPLLEELRAAYPAAEFVGWKRGADLAWWYAQADVFVFPSRTETFGLVMLEANASGTPVAAFPVTGPVDLIQPGVNGALDEDLGAAVERALTVDRQSCRRVAELRSWKRSAGAFRKRLRPLNWSRVRSLWPPGWRWLPRDGGIPDAR